MSALDAALAAGVLALVAFNVWTLHHWRKLAAELYEVAYGRRKDKAWAPPDAPRNAPRSPGPLAFLEAHEERRRRRSEPATRQPRRQAIRRWKRTAAYRLLAQWGLVRHDEREDTR